MILKNKIVFYNENSVKCCIAQSFIGEQVTVRSSEATTGMLGEVTSIDNSVATIKLLTRGEVSSDMFVYQKGRAYSIPINDSIMGKVIDCYGNTIYGEQYHYTANDLMPVTMQKFELSQRAPISQLLETKVKVVDLFTPIGVGQRMGIFAPAGCGKTTLLSIIANNVDVDVVVFAMIGERAREVVEFLEGDITPDVLAKSITLVSTSEANPIEKVRTAEAALTIANNFRKQGLKVLLLFDSITRYGRAKALVDETPIRGGVPLGVSNAIANIVEQCGNALIGSITAVFTVLVEKSIEDDPIAHETKSLIDGHILLSQSIAASGRYPAVDVLNSLSRIAPKIVNKEHLSISSKIRSWEKTYQDVEILIRVGEYKHGNDLETDEAIDKRDRYIKLLCQSEDGVTYEETLYSATTIVNS